ncbi:hypothetical protein NG895_10985 [Aeoliella sp. ICT_H6.2]|uniref:Mannosyl-glycoprotein endo-beta-N-acetylglucosaminidase n=1 Tax=Aeoliella straminimaris TaxID=2954799 RepID=A0A9X2F8U3_9BACT|nr:hypothetical protein [Aeoliella straminimaris]MCO6044430.1 hypothetical protein [Aeoliella straminimaris]
MSIRPYGSCVVLAILATCAGTLDCRADLPLQPYVSYWKPNSDPNPLLGYDYHTDPDAQFNKGSVPLASRFLNPALQANPHARPNEARIMSLAAFHATSNNPSQGSDSHRYYAFSHWQYVDALVFWGGSAGEGNILAPNGPIIDAAHRNGVPVYGTIFLPPNVYGGDIGRLEDLVYERRAGRFPVADQLIEVAERNGFDGWFFNQETHGADPELASQTREFMKYIQNNSDLDVVWYDSMLENGSISWQGELNQSNNSYYEGSSTDDRAADSMFLDFRWNASKLNNSGNYAEQLGRDKYEIYAGVDVEGSGWNQNRVSLDDAFPEGQPHRSSLGFYRPEWTLNSTSTIEGFYERDSQFWVGANGDPSDTSGSVGSRNWKGMAHYVPAKSPISGDAFVTNFNMGQGFNYWVDGELSRSGEWNNLGLQDVVPTWRWLLDASSNPLTPEIDFDDAFYGGSSLRVSGNLTSQNDLRLYATSLRVSSSSNLQVAFKTAAPATDSNMEVLVAFADDPTSFTALPVGTSTGADWELVTLPLSQFRGRTIAQLGLRFDGSDSNYDINIGRLGVIEGQADAPVAPTNLVLLDYAQVDSTRYTMRLEWEHSADYAGDGTNEVYYYNLYKVTPGGVRTFLGGTLNNSFFVRDLPRSAREASTTIEVEAVSNEFGVSDVSSFTLNWRNLPTGLAGDYNNDGIVDLADYTVWRNNLGGQASSLFNNPYATNVGSQQYTIWKANYGAVAASSSQNAVPEPSNLALVSLAMLSTIAYRWRKLSG